MGPHRIQQQTWYKKLTGGQLLVDWSELWTWVCSVDFLYIAHVCPALLCLPLPDLCLNGTKLFVFPCV